MFEESTKIKKGEKKGCEREEKKFQIFQEDRILQAFLKLGCLIIHLMVQAAVRHHGNALMHDNGSPCLCAVKKKVCHNLWFRTEL